MLQQLPKFSPHAYHVHVDAFTDKVHLVAQGVHVATSSSIMQTSSFVRSP
jgi:hypothetical protein